MNFKEGVDMLPFEARMLGEAGVLLAKQHMRNRELVPLLPGRYEDPTMAATALKAVWEKSGAMGVAVCQNQKLKGFLIGNVAIDSIRGRHAWIHPAGAALEEQLDSELYRDMYAALGEIWVKNGIFDHFVLLPANGHASLDPWLRVGFSYEQTHALMNLRDSRIDSLKRNPEFTVRRAIPEDREIVQSFSKEIARTHAGRPVWGAALPEDIPETRDGYGEILEDEAFITWLAFLDGKAVGMQAYRTLTGSHQNLLTPDKTIRLIVGSTLPESRGKGVSTTLLWAGLQHAIGQGYEFCETDWRATHLLASRYWPKRGFESVAERLVRKVDPRISWANGYNEIDIRGRDGLRKS